MLEARRFPQASSAALNKLQQRGEQEELLPTMFMQPCCLTIRLAHHSQPLKLQQSEMEPEPGPAAFSPWKKGSNSQLKSYITYLGQHIPKAQISPALSNAPKCL